MSPVDPQPAVTAGPRRTRLARALVAAGATELLVLGAAVAASFLTDWTGRLAWLVAPVLAVVVGMGKVLIEQTVPERRAQPSRPPASTPPTFPPSYPPGGATAPPRAAQPWSPPPRRGTPLGVAVLVVLLVVGGGGLGLTLGVRFVTGYVTGNETGVERLEERVSATDSGLTLEVTSVVETAHFTRVGIVVRNDLPSTVSLPLFRNASLATEDGVTLDADAFRSSFSETVPPGAARRGTLVFPGRPPEGATTLALTFATVYEQGLDGPSSLTAPGLVLRPAGADAARRAASAQTGGGDGRT